MLAFAALACGPRAGEHAPSPAAQAGPLLVEVTAEAGLPAPPRPWPAGSYALPEIMGAGVGLFDYDNDGDLDLLQVRFPPPGREQEPAPNRLWAQVAPLRFRDVTETAGLGHPGYGQAVAVGDLDNDGDLDVFFGNYGADALFLNRGDGTFEDITRLSGIAGEAWSSSATFCDYDRDGDLDLYVVHYLRYSPGMHCGLAAEDYCGPSEFDGVPDTLYRNEGGGRFREVTEQAGLQLPEGGRAAKGLGVVCFDLTGDDWPDFYVANDGEPNQLWVNQRDGTFRDEAILRGVAVNRAGMPEASMGIAVGDVNADGLLDLFLTHLSRETNTLYLATPGWLYEDRTLEAGLERYGLAETGFGCGLFDYDHDGDLDLAVVNGRVSRGEARPGAALGSFWNLYAEPHFLLENDGRGFFVDASARAGSFASAIELRRGLAFGDLDDDGDVDLVTSTHDGGLRLFRNDAGGGGHWLRVQALTRGRDALGARLELIAGGRRRVAAVLTTSSYQSSNDPRVHFGLGSAEGAEAIEVVWPDGMRERFAVESVDREIVLVQGRGQAR